MVENRQIAIIVVVFLVGQVRDQLNEEGEDEAVVGILPDDAGQKPGEELQGFHIMLGQQILAGLFLLACHERDDASGGDVILIIDFDAFGNRLRTGAKEGLQVFRKAHGGGDWGQLGVGVPSGTDGKGDNG